MINNLSAYLQALFILRDNKVYDNALFLITHEP